MSQQPETPKTPHADPKLCKMGCGFFVSLNFVVCPNPWPAAVGLFQRERAVFAVLLMLLLSAGGNVTSSTPPCCWAFSNLQLRILLLSFRNGGPARRREMHRFALYFIRSISLIPTDFLIDRGTMRLETAAPNAGPKSSRKRMTQQKRRRRNSHQFLLKSKATNSF